MYWAPEGAINSLLLKPFGSMDCSFLAPGDALMVSFLPSMAVTEVSLNCVLPPKTTTLFPAASNSPFTSAPCGITMLPVIRMSCRARNLSGVPGSEPEGTSEASAIGIGVPATIVTGCSTTTGAPVPAGEGGAVTVGGGATETG